MKVESFLGKVNMQKIQNTATWCWWYTNHFKSCIEVEETKKEVTEGQRINSQRRSNNYKFYTHRIKAPKYVK